MNSKYLLLLIILSFNFLSPLSANEIYAHYCKIRPPNPCFLPGTKIALATGDDKPIEDIYIGEYVLGYDENLDRVLTKKVINTFVHHNIKEYYVLTLEDGRIIEVTGNHPIYNGEKYIEVRNIAIGDEITTLSEKNKLEEIKVIDIKIVNSDVTVYNLEVETTHNYFAEGCLVHNKNIYEMHNLSP